jgi:Polysaccharide pyruvyl transferase
MFRNALVVGVQQVYSRNEGTSVEQTMLSLGQNTGNLMFTQSLLSLVDRAAWGSFSLSPKEIEGHDAIVLAAANWVNNFDDFGWLADRLEKIQLPVFLIGIGAQAANSKEIPNVSKGTLRLLEIVRDRSVTISARGTFSCEVLERYGIKNVRPTGCPSLLLVGPKGPKSSLLREVSFDSCCTHATRHGYGKADAFQTFLYRQAFTRKIDLVLQSEVADIHYVMNAATNQPIPSNAKEALTAAYGVQEVEQAISYLSRHGHVFTCYSDWISYMEKRSFCFGTRIHGTIAALIAGTPATLIVHDSRTLEMAEIMGVPIVRADEISTELEIDIPKLYSNLQMKSFDRTFAGYYLNFINYFAENSIPVNQNYALAQQQPPKMMI